MRTHNYNVYFGMFHVPVTETRILTCFLGIATVTRRWSISILYTHHNYKIHMNKSNCCRNVSMNGTLEIFQRVSWLQSTPQIKPLHGYCVTLGINLLTKSVVISKRNKKRLHPIPSVLVGNRDDFHCLKNNLYRRVFYNQNIPYINKPQTLHFSGRGAVLLLQCYNHLNN